MHPAWLRSESLEYLDIPVLSRLASQAPQHLKLRIYFWANPYCFTPEIIFDPEQEE